MLREFHTAELNNKTVLVRMRTTSSDKRKRHSQRNAPGQQTRRDAAVLKTAARRLKCLAHLIPTLFRSENARVPVLSNLTDRRVGVKRVNYRFAKIFRLAHDVAGQKIAEPRLTVPTNDPRDPRLEKTPKAVLSSSSVKSYFFLPILVY